MWEIRVLWEGEAVRMNKRKHRKRIRDKKQNKTSSAPNTTPPNKITTVVSTAPVPTPTVSKLFSFGLNFWFGVIGVVGTIVSILALWLYFSDKKADALAGKLNSPLTANQMLIALGSTKI
jgi:hypothetical protein